MGGDVVGEINYLTSTSDGLSPWLTASSIPTALRSNIIQSLIPVTIHDLRDKEKSVDLDTNALEVLKYDGSIQEEFENGSKEQHNYFEEITNILKKHLGASRIIIYHYTFRSRSSNLTDDQCDHNHRNPVLYPHVDTDPAGVYALVEKTLGKEEAEKVKQNRIQVINIWRPLGPNPIIEKPLAICDYRSLDVDKDVHPLSLPGATYHSTAYSLSANAQNAHIWYYLSQMKSDEMFAFKMFDSKPDVAQLAFHTAFINRNALAANAKQESLELRCMIFYDE